MLNVETKYQNFRIDIKRFKTVKLINSGPFGCIYLCKDIKTNEKFVAKVLICHKDEDKYKKMVNNEICIMINCCFPTIIKIVGFSSKDFHGEPNATIIMEYAEQGSLEDLIQKSKIGQTDIIYDNTARQKILIGIARGMMFLHQHHIMHRDLKPSNILLDNDLHPHISDFGFAKMFTRDQILEQSQQCWTLIYMAPEVLLDNKYNAKADVYSFAILMYQIVTDLFPYPILQEGKITDFQFFSLIVNENLRPEFPNEIKKPIQLLIQKCWDRNPENRPSFEEIYNLLSNTQNDMIYNIFDDKTASIKKAGEYDYYLDNVNIEEINSYIEEIEDNVIDKKSSYYQLMEKISYYEDKNLALKKQVEKLELQNSELKSEISNISSDNKSMKKRIKSFKKQNELANLIQSENEKVTSINVQLNKRIEKLSQELEESRQKNDELKDQLSECQDEIEYIKQKNNDLHKQITNYQNENERVKHENDNLKIQINHHAIIDDEKEQENQVDMLIDTITISDFNSLSLKIQLLVASKIDLCTQSFFLLRPFSSSLFLKIRNLLLYILNANTESPSYHNFEIKSTNGDTKLIDAKNNTQIFEEIIVHAKSVEMLYQKKSLENEEFYKVLNQFEIIWIEFKYPSQSFDIALELKKLLNDSIKISVLISEGVETDFKFKDSKIINSARFDHTIRSIGESTFYGCNKLEKVLFDNDSVIEFFGANAFFECFSLTQINIPSSVISIEKSAFYGCNSLINVSFDFPSSLKSIGDYAFDGCSSLTKIEIPLSVNEIGEYAFARCFSLKYVSFSFFTTKVSPNSFPENLHVSCA